MTTKHTPGPWIGAGPSFGDPLPRYTTEIITESEDENGEVRSICELPVAHYDDENEANAHLIAAAPELLEAVIELKDVCNRPSAARTRAEAWRKLDKAIAKALQPNAQVHGRPAVPCNGGLDDFQKKGIKMLEPITIGDGDMHCAPECPHLLPDHERLCCGTCRLDGRHLGYHDWYLAHCKSQLSDEASNA